MTLLWNVLQAFAPSYDLFAISRVLPTVMSSNGGRGHFVTLSDRIYRIFRILFCLSTFPEESLKSKSLREKESGSVMGNIGSLSLY